MANEKNNSNYSNVVEKKDRKELAFKDLGAKFGHAMAVKNERGKFVIVYIGNQICGEEFDTVEQVRRFMKENPYQLLPLIATIHTKEFLKIENAKKD